MRSERPTAPLTEAEKAELLALGRIDRAADGYALHRTEPRDQL